ncbi:helix-turn-helix domain-containing protein [Sphingobium sp. JS3065]|jgi:transcriptional regulator with XRE-family HTH domain|uniref:helix-turn-helix domain-containing protein n=1 Tax=Sphingobium sp. JS3065 TaxID=2970925 RepID=UPI002263E826|nr:helix-turn-helix domain-containing protein [Sphingobium sp. JS3065]UZW57678.1 helix-turn-helix domain-containing protein [Sphingobium sp. JS3065]
MPTRRLQTKDNVLVLSRIKEISGKRIEERRRRDRITQPQLARAAGVSVRWLREIEAGNPKSKLDEHLACAHRLGLSTTHIMIPLLLMERRMSIPEEYLVEEDLSELEDRCIALVYEHSQAAVTRRRSSFFGPGDDGEPS